MHCIKRISFIQSTALEGLLLAIWIIGATSTAATPIAEGSEGPEQRLQILLAQKEARSSDPEFLVHMADLYLDLGDDVYTIQSQRRAAYEEGARIARQAISIQEGNARAHYLYAANLGSAAQLTGVMASAFTIQELKVHTRRALEINHNHAPALHLMGMMLEQLPWILGGDREGALSYLRRAVKADPAYAHARMDLAKAYLRRNDSDAARRELELILRQPIPTSASESDRRRRMEASKLLESLSH